MPKTPDSTRSLARRTNHAQEHLRLYEIATVRSLACNVCQGDHIVAQQLATMMVDRSGWHLHRSGGGDRTVDYFTLSELPPRRSDLRRRLAVLAFSTYGVVAQPVLNAAKFRSVMEPVTSRAGLPFPPWRPCYIHRRNRTDPKCLSLIRVGTTTDLNAVVDELDRFVSSSAFLPWWYFASIGYFDVTYLLPAPRPEADELGRWLRRRVPVSTIKDRAVQVPVFVYDTPHTPV